LPDKKKKIDMKWVFKVKLNPDGKGSKHKARLISRGFMQKYGIDNNEVFAPVARIETVRLVVAIACKNEWLLYHLDVKSAFLNGPLEDLVFVSQLKVRKTTRRGGGGGGGLILFFETYCFTL